MLPLLFSLACSTPQPIDATPTGEASSPGEPVAGDTLVVAVGFDPGNLNPIVAPYALSGVYINATQPGLAERKVSPEGLTYAPDLAESWTWAEDGKSLTYTLREGLVWDDGTPLTAHDVAFSYALIQDPAVASNWHGDGKNLKDIQVIDDRTITFHFPSGGNPVLLQGVTIRGIVPQHVLGDADRATLRGHDYSKAPSASGPWRVASWSPGETLVLEPNPAQTVFEKPLLDRIVTRVIPEYSTRLLEFQNGTNDLVTSIEKHDLESLARDYPQIRLIRMKSVSMQYIGWNTQDPHFANPEVRRAMTLAIDRDKLIDDLFTTGGEVYAGPCVGTVGPNLTGWHNDELKPAPHDPDQARQLLREAGWLDQDGDGVLDRDGKPFTVTVIVQNGYLQLKNLSIAIQAQLKAVGVDLQIQLLEPNRFSQVAREHDFEVILWSFGNNPKVDPYIQWHSEGQYNWMQYSDPETDALLEGARTVESVEEAQSMVREAQARVFEANPATFLFWEDEVNGIHERFQDVQMNQFTFLEDSERWWVPANRQKY